MKKTNFEAMTVQQILAVQSKIEDLLSKCGTPFTPPDSVTHNVQKVAEQLDMNASDMQCLHMLLLNDSAMKPGELRRCCGPCRPMS